jgi:hypothetical protein
MRAHLLAVLLLTGCSCGRAYTTAVAGDGGAEAFDPEGVPTRCFEGAHTIVVGPEPGCASLEVTGVEDYECPSVHSDEGWRGTPLRIVRRGELLVRLTVLPRCSGCADSEDPDAPQVIRMLGATDDGLAPLCESCGIGTIHRVGDEVVGYGRTNTELGFATLEFGDTSELLLVGPETVFDVQACAVETTAEMQRFIDACQPYCAACSPRVSLCQLTCLDAAVLEPETCLEARTALASCLTNLGCEAPCDTERVRVEYECRAP